MFLRQAGHRHLRPRVDLRRIEDPLYGRPYAVAVAESLDVDITYQPSPSLCLATGIIEGKRVFTRQRSDLYSKCDRSAKVTFTRCTSLPTVQHSTGC
jgi:hypothetical protein